jgi:hypothetical protein
MVVGIGLATAQQFHSEGNQKNKVRICGAFLITHKQCFYSPHPPRKSPRFDHQKTTLEPHFFKTLQKKPTKSPKSALHHRKIFFSV